MDKIKELQKIINESTGIVFFGGAGVSTESGIPDFRSQDGLYNQKYDYPPESILSHTFFVHKTEEFYKFYKDKFNLLNYKPNAVHNYLAALEKKGKLKAIITQNIDGLHTKAGNKNVYEVHGTIYRNHCIKCHKEYDANYVFNSKGVPKCNCGGIVKPDVVLYGEALPEKDYIGGLSAISKADMLIVCGSSLTVYPASGMVDNFNGKYLIIINNTKTPYDYKANLVINDNLSKVFSKLK
jgi:NAD-dependent deacetylase